jgi:gamma-glutamylcyclotransferase (GGCT)/AIG2-like uncharacterized protein YtfP
MAPSDLTVFVYGTLKPGGRYWPEFCEGKVLDSVPAKIRGELYDLHLGYPGLILRGDGWVHGYLHTFTTEVDFRRLDDLEGYDPGRPYPENEYIRKKIQAYSADDEPVGQAWAYEITRHVLAACRGTRLPGGSWPV